MKLFRWPCWPCRSCTEGELRIVIVRRAGRSRYPVGEDWCMRIEPLLPRNPGAAFVGGHLTILEWVTTQVALGDACETVSELVWLGNDVCSRNRLLPQNRVQRTELSSRSFFTGITANSEASMCSGASFKPWVREPVVPRSVSQPGPRVL